MCWQGNFCFAVIFSRSSLTPARPPNSTLSFAIALSVNSGVQGFEVHFGYIFAA